MRGRSQLRGLIAKQLLVLGFFDFPMGFSMKTNHPHTVYTRLFGNDCDRFTPLIRGDAPKDFVRFIISIGDEYGIEVRWIDSDSLQLQGRPLANETSERSLVRRPVTLVHQLE